jgi:hypothetical protein
MKSYNISIKLHTQNNAHILNHTHTKENAQIENHTHKNQLCNSKIIIFKNNAQFFFTNIEKPKKQYNYKRGGGEFCKIGWGEKLGKRENLIAQQKNKKTPKTLSCTYLTITMNPK